MKRIAMPSVAVGAVVALSWCAAGQAMGEQALYFQRFDDEGDAMFDEPTDTFSWLPRVVNSTLVLGDTSHMWLLRGQ